MAVEEINFSCNGCGICVDICPLDVFRMDNNKNRAYIAYPQDCQSCLLCELYCPVDAIYVSASRARLIPVPW